MEVRGNPEKNICHGASLEFGGDSSDSLNTDTLLSLADGRKRCSHLEPVVPDKAVKFRKVEVAGSCVVPYVSQGGVPFFRLSSQKCLDTPRVGDTALCYHPEENHLVNILIDEIQNLAEQLFFIKGLRCSFDASNQALTMAFNGSQGKGGERCQLPLILGVDFLKGRKPFTQDKTNSPDYAPKTVVINFNSGEVTYTPIFGEESSCTLPHLSASQSHSVLDSLKHIRYLLLQRVLGEFTFTHKVLEKLDSNLEQDQKRQWLDSLSSFDRLTVDDPDRLGFRLKVVEQEDGLHITLADINPVVMENLWGCSDPQKVLTLIKEQIITLIPETTADENNQLLIPVSAHGLVNRLKECVVENVGIAFINQNGSILRAPFVLRSGDPWASPGGAAKTRFCPLLGAVVEAYAESNIIPVSLSSWHSMRPYEGQRKAGNAVFTVEPGGFDDSAGIYDRAHPILEFDNENWQWFDFQELRDGELDNRPLRGVCTDIFSYLAFEEARIAQALSNRFPGVSVTVYGANADLAQEDSVYGITKVDADVLPGDKFGIVVIKPENQAQAVAIEQWLMEQGLSYKQTASHTFQLKDNPFTVYQKCKTNDLVQVQKVENPCSRCFIDKPSHLQPLPQALVELKTLREKLAVASVHKETRLQAGVPLQAHEKEPHQEPVTLDEFSSLREEPSGAGLFCHNRTGTLYHLKPVDDQDAARSEVLMANLARASGLNVPETSLIEGKGKFWIVTPWVEGLVTGEGTLTRLDRHQLARLFITAAWLGNRNIIGKNFDHTAVGGDQCIYGLNWCGAGYYSGGRHRKTVDNLIGSGGFFGTVFELKDMCNGGMHRSAARVFASLTEEDIEAVIPEFLEQAPCRVSELVKQYGPEGEAERHYLEKTLYDRLVYLGMCYPKCLPPVTESELKSIAFNGLHGTEIAVSSQHLQRQSIIVGHRFNEQGEGETQLYFELCPKKTHEFSQQLGLPKSNYELGARLAYFLSSSITGKTMTEALHKDLQETSDMAVSLKETLENCLKREEQELGQRAVFREKSQKTLPESIKDLEAYINSLKELLATENGCPVPALPEGASIPLSRSIVDLPEFLPERVRTDRQDALPVYQVSNRQSHATRERAAFPENTWFYQIDFVPGEETPLQSFTAPPIPIVMEFHGFDSDARSFDGQVRLIATGQDKNTVESLLQWLRASGLISQQRPNTEAMQKQYIQRLEADGVDLSQCAADKLGWQNNIRRVNGRNIDLLPAAVRLKKAECDKYRNTHQLSYFGSKTDYSRLQSILHTSLALNSFCDRVSAGGDINGLRNKDNIPTEGGKLVFTNIRSREDAYRYSHLVMRPWLLNRADAHCIRSTMTRFQSWRLRHSGTHLKELPEKPEDDHMQCDYSMPISLPESLEHISVDNYHEEQSVLRILKSEGWRHWPDGRCVEKVVKAERTLQQEYDNCISTSSHLSVGAAFIVKKAGYSQFEQLLQVNPNLFDDKKISSLSGIAVENITLTRWKLGGITFHNARLSKVIFENCYFKGCDFSQCDLSGVEFKFNNPESHHEEIVYLSEHFENIFISNGDKQLLMKTIQLQIDTGRIHFAQQLIEKHSEHLGEEEIISYCQLLLKKEGTDFASLLNFIERSEVPTKKIKKLKLSCVALVSTERLSVLIQQMAPDELCTLIDSSDVSQSVKAVCVRHFIRGIVNDKRYDILSKVTVIPELYEAIDKENIDNPNPVFYLYLVMHGKKHGKTKDDLINLIKQGIEYCPQCQELLAVKLSDICSVDIDLTVSSLLNNDEETWALFRRKREGMKFSCFTWEQVNDCYQIDLAINPNDVSVYAGFMEHLGSRSVNFYERGIKYFKVGGAFIICKKGLMKFSDSCPEKKQLLEKMIHLAESDKDLFPDILKTIHEELDDNDSWELYLLMNKIVLGCNSILDNSFMLNFYQQALVFWPDNLEIYKDFMRRASACSLIKKEGGKEVYSRELAFNICKMALNQFAESTEKKKELLDIIIPIARIEDYCEILSVSQVNLNADDVLNVFLCIEKEISCVFADSSRRAVFDLYMLALTIWPEDIDLYIKAMRILRKHCIYVYENNKAKFAGDLIQRVYEMGQKQFEEGTPFREMLEENYKTYM